MYFEKNGTVAIVRHSKKGRRFRDFQEHPVFMENPDLEVGRGYLEKKDTKERLVIVGVYWPVRKENQVLMVWEGHLEIPDHKDIREFLDRKEIVGQL